METPGDFYSVQRNDHDYYGNTEKANGSPVSQVSNSENVDNINDMLAESTESEKQSNEESGNFEMIEEEIIDSSAVGSGEIEASVATGDEPANESVAGDGGTCETSNAGGSQVTEVNDASQDGHDDASSKKLLDPDAESKRINDDFDFSLSDELIEGGELSVLTNVEHSTISTMSDDSNGDEPYVSDVSSTIAENEVSETFSSSKAVSLKPRKRTRQPPIMIGYKKRRKAQHAKKYDEESSDLVAKLPVKSENGPVEIIFNSEAEGSLDDKSESSRKSLEQSSSEENLTDSWAGSNCRKYSSTGNEVTDADKFCWICHKDGSSVPPNTVLKCIACPRIFHTKCLQQLGYTDSKEDPSSFHCPECSAVLKADNVNTRSPVLVSVNLEQLCTLLKHIIDILKSQKESYYFWGPVDTKEFPQYREYVVYPMDLAVLEKNVKNKVYGCTEAFLADVKWIVHNSIVFNSQAAKITNVAKNLLKICKREIFEIETCAECYYNSLVRKDTWFIEVCKKPHILVWARLKGYPPWPAKAMRCRDSMVDCRFFGAHDKAWVPLKDCFLYSKSCPQPVKVKKGSHLEGGIQELEKHIKKLKDRYGIFTYPNARIPYRPSQELEQLRMMLPNYNPKSSVRPTKYLIHPDRVKSDLKPKAIFDDDKQKSITSVPVAKEENDSNEIDKTLDEADSESTATEDTDKLPDAASHDESGDESSSANSSESEAPTVKDGDGVERLEQSVEPSLGIEDRQLKDGPNDDSVVVAEHAPAVSTAPAAQKIDAETSTEKMDDAATAIVRKLVSVKNIESINATMATSSSSARRDLSKSSSPELPPVVSATSEDALKATNVESVGTLPAPVVEPASTKEAGCARNVSQESKASERIAQKSVSVGTDSFFDLNKVKDEPVDNTTTAQPDVEKSEKMAVQAPAPPKIDVKVAEPPTVNNGSLKVKRAAELEDDTSVAKKTKPDPNCRTVNITENVTLSLINQGPTDANKSPRLVSLNVPPKKPPKVYQTFATPGTRLVYTGASNVEASAGTRHKLAPPSGVTSMTNVPRAQPKVHNRVVTNMPHVNGSVGAPVTKNAVTLITPSKPAPKAVPESHDSVTKMLDECASECQVQIRRMLENTLDKLAGKGDLRAKIISLKKEIETLKRSHELTIDEMKRDYELQIAELRATSIAKTQFDLAAERLRFEQEKERAVKEAKSKQWCSNCQKIANYYCCWNTAYCDFNCQKDHWIQHMYVCKNDVKKKAAESSENEPPRIMMQNEDTNNYMLNGFDKPNSTFTFTNSSSNATAHSRSNFHRVQTKTTNASRSASRPLLPRVTTVISNSPTPNSLSGGTCIVGNSQSTFIDPNVYQNVTSNSSTTLRPSVYTTTVNSFVRHSPQFHK